MTTTDETYTYLYLLLKRVRFPPKFLIWHVGLVRLCYWRVGLNRSHMRVRRICGTAPGARRWPAFSRCALGPVPLVSCAKHGVWCLGSLLKMGSCDGEVLPDDGASELCLNSDKNIGFQLEDGAAKWTGAFSSSSIEGASRTKCN